MNRDSDLIDAYLDGLLAEMRDRPQTARRALAEAEDHLRQASEEMHAVGASWQDAQRVAIQRFGTPRLVARRFAQAEGELSIITGGAVTAMQVAGVGLTAIGLSGLIVGAMTLLLGAPYVQGSDVSRISVGPSSCRELLDQNPWATTCEIAYQHSALLSDLTTRLVPGALGILVLGGLWLLSRGRTGLSLVLPADTAAWILVTAGVVVAMSLATGRDPGIGDHLAGIISALALIVTCLASLRRRHRPPAPRVATR